MSLLEAAIGWLAPPDCVVCGLEGRAFCEACAVTEIIPFGERCYGCNKLSFDGRTCPTCRPSSPSYVWVTTEYKDSVRLLVQKLKFTHQRAAAGPIAQLMVDTLLTYKAREEIAGYMVMPVPTATSRYRERSFDHTALIARNLAKRLGVPVSGNLKRLGQSRQVGARRALRQKQLTDAYYVLLPSLVKGRKVLLIDDVVTTGATLRAATKALRRAGARQVDALVFAKKL